MASFTWQELSQAPLPTTVEQVLQQLEDSGFEAYVVGGGPRNLLWGYPVNDWDITTNAPLERLRQWYGSRHPGVRFGTVAAYPHVEVTTMRRDWGTTDGRHPERVEAVGELQTDLQRRDFTVNTVAFNRHTVRTLPGSLDDLRNRVWRAVGNPMRRFEEDGLRLLRLARFVGTYGGRIEARTWDGAWNARDCSLKVSRERRVGELWHILRASQRTWQLLSHVGMTTALELPRRRFAAENWPEPATMDARLLFFLFGFSGDWERVRAWLELWPLRRGLRRELLAATRRLGDTPDRDGWAVWARMGGTGSRTLGDWAREAGYSRTVEPLVLAIDGHWLRQQFTLPSQAEGTILKTVRRQIAQFPDLNTPEHIARLLQEMGWAKRKNGPQ